MDGTSRPAIAPEILENLRPVRRLGRPWKRALPALGLAAITALLVFAGFGVRADARQLGRAALWGLSLLQACYGGALIALALRTAVPGRELRRIVHVLLALAAAGVVLTVTFVTWSAHPSHVRPGRETLYWTVCFSTPVVVGLPALLLTLLLAFRAYPTNPALTGGLAGLGAGLLSDGSWRTYCEVSDPVHVLSSHAASVLLLTLAGVAAAWGWSIVSRRALR